MNYEYMTAMKAGVREMRVRGQCTFPGGVTTEVSCGDIVSVRISEGNDSGILPGNVLSAACTLVLDDSGGDWREGGEKRGYNALAGAMFELELGVLTGEGWKYEPLGAFVCREAASDEGSTAVTLTCSDMIDARCAGVFTDGLTYPATLGDIWEHICAQAGLEWSGHMPCGDIVIDAKPRWGDISVRTAMGYAAQASGCFVRAGRSGELVLKPVWGDGETYDIGPEEYISRSRCEGYFGPVKGLRVTTVNAEGDEDSESGEFLAGISGGDNAEMCIKGNPLYITGGEHVQELAQGTMAVLDGLEYRESRFLWRGDPSVEPGMFVGITGLDGGVTRCCVSRQTMEFSGGFTAEIVCGVPDDGGVRTVYVGTGRETDAGLLIGVVPGANIAVNAITAQKIAAGAVSAEKIAAGAITAEKISAGSVTADKIETGAVTADKIAAGSITAEKIAAKTITAEQLKAGLLTADSGLIAVGAIQTAQIADGSITSAKIVSLNADVIDAGTIKTDRLLLVGEGGVVYEINAASSGLSQTELSKEQYRKYLNGTVIVANSITAAQIAAGTITANEIAANAITAAKINVADLFASEATIAQINAMDISGNNYLKLMVEGGINLIKDSAKGASGTGYPLVGYDLAETIEAGETMTFTIWDAALGAGKTFWSLYDGSGIHGHTILEDRGNGVYSATFTFNGDGNTSRVLLYAFPGDVGGVVSTVGKVKLERGSRSTSWTPSPLDPATEVIAGSTVVINEEKVEISTPKFEVNTNGAEFNIPSETEDGSQIVRIDSDGLHADVINGPVVQTHEGGVYFVGGSGDHAALQDVFDEINDRRLNGDVVIKLLGSVPGGTIRGVSGPGKVIIAPVNLLNTSDGKAWTNNSATAYSMGQTAGVYLVPNAAGSNKYATYSLGHVGALGIIGQRLTLRCQMYCYSSDVPAYPRIVVYVGGKAVTTLVDNDIAAWDTISISFNIPADALPEDEIQLLFYAATTYQTIAANAQAYFRDPCLEIGWSISDQNTLLNAAAAGSITAEGCTAQICLHRTSFLYDGDAFGIKATGSNVALNRCTLYRPHSLSVWGGSGAMYNCYGSANVRAAGGGAIEIVGCAPYGNKTGLVDVSNMQGIADTGDSPAATPTPIEIKADTTGTYSGGAWWTSDAGIRQGYTSANGTLRGAMWFDGVPESGVSKMTLRLRRVAGYGKGGDVKVRIYGTTAGKKSGNPMSGATSNYIEGSIGPDEAKTFDVTDLSTDRNYSAYVVYIADSGVMDGKSYSTNFARFSGTGSANYAPVLTVTT